MKIAKSTSHTHISRIHFSLIPFKNAEKKRKKFKLDNKKHSTMMYQHIDHRHLWDLQNDYMMYVSYQYVSTTVQLFVCLVIRP